MTQVPYGNTNVTKPDGPHARPFRANLRLLDRLDEKAKQAAQLKAQPKRTPRLLWPRRGRRREN